MGEILAVSLAQGGPPPAFFYSWCYTFLCTGEIELNNLTVEDVSDNEYCTLISRVSGFESNVFVHLLFYTNESKMATTFFW